ncbi:MAG: YkvA family protein [Dehalococcoidia bacterium]
MEDLLLATLICTGVAFAILLIGAGFIAWRVYRSDERKVARRIGKLPIRDKLAFGRALFADARVPVWAKIVAFAVVVYLASPIDLLPDFIPVIGFVDDVLIVMAGVGLLLRAVPAAVIEEHLQFFEAPRETRDSDALPMPPAGSRQR